MIVGPSKKRGYGLNTVTPFAFLVELTGFEPATYALRTRRSPS